MSQPEQTGKLAMNAKTERSRILSTGLSRVNRLTRAAAHLGDLLPAFEQWSAGEIYVCRKTGDYRHRFGDRSKSVAPWNRLARSLFPTVADFAFAAAVFAQETPQEPAEAPRAISTRDAAGTRVNVISMAQEVAA